MRPQIVDITPTHDESAQEFPDYGLGEVEKPDLTPPRQDAFGDEEHAEVKYKVLTWWYVVFLVSPESRIEKSTFC
jgi:hypothetical protein